MKINILYKIKDGPWGGVNQFLKALKKELQNRGVYEEDIKKADVIIYNSYHDLLKIIGLKINYPKKIFVHRLGPIFCLYRGKKWKIIDSLIINASNLISNLIIFQSRWSYEKSLQFSLEKNKQIEIIGNSPDEEIFNLKPKEKNDSRFKLVSDSWSSNLKKGFEYYDFLDNHLDFSRYQMTFIGNSPIKFKNIKSVAPLPSKELAEELQKSDIFISAVCNDAYSNTIAEALACGLPVVALKSGGNAEIIKKGGELFENKSEMIPKIELVRNDYERYQKNIDAKSIRDITDQYLLAIKKAVASKDLMAKPDKIRLIGLYLKACLTIWAFKILRYVI